MFEIYMSILAVLVLLGSLGILGLQLYLEHKLKQETKRLFPDFYAQRYRNKKGSKK